MKFYYIFCKMKKFLFVILSLVAVLLAGCNKSTNQLIEVNPVERESENWVSIEESFNNQVEWYQYLKDLEDFISYEVLSITENKPFNSKIWFTANFDEKSSVQWWVDFSEKKLSQNKDLELFDIDFSVNIQNDENDAEPIDTQWSISVLYQNNELYANIHDFDLYMWEWNVVAKMYSLIWDMLVDKWVDLEVNSWWIISVDTDKDTKLSYIVWTIKNVLKTQSDSPDFLWSVVELIDMINGYINLWISTDELKVNSEDISYFELVDWNIQKQFTWEFLGKDSSFMMSFVTSENWLSLRIFDIKEYDEDLSDYRDMDLEFLFSVEENKKSEYNVWFKSIKYRQTVADIQWKIKYWDAVDFDANFLLEPIELADGQKISWKMQWNIEKTFWEWGMQIPEIPADSIISFSEILWSM